MKKHPLFKLYDHRADIERQVNVEDINLWAKRPVPEFKPIPALPRAQKPPYEMLRHMVRQWIP